MILAIEGPDRCGKTTLLNALRATGLDATFVPSLPVSNELLSVMSLVERRDELLWQSLYDSKKLYICDRTFAVSGPVYARLYGRPILDVSRWIEHLAVVYLRLSVQELVARHNATPDEYFDVKRCAEIVDIYDDHVIRLKRKLWLDASKSVEFLTLEVLRWKRFNWNTENG